jgi:two-component system, sensor histidine kinase LadS
MSSIKLIILYVLAFLSTSVTGYTQFKIEPSTVFAQQSLHKHAFILNCKQKELSITEVLKLPKSDFKSLKNENTDLGFTDDNYWLQFKIANKTTNELNYYIETSRPLVDFAELYQVLNDGKIKVQISGDNIAFTKRSVQLRKTVFKIRLKPLEIGNYYIHLKSDGEVINAPVILRTFDNLIEQISIEQLVFGSFYGILIIASILYFFFFIGIREKVFLYYSLYVVFIGLLQFSLDGYFYQYIDPSGGWLSNKSVLLFAIISGFFLGKYTQFYLNVPKVSYRINTLFKILYVLFGILFFVLLFIPSLFKYCYPAMNALGLFLLVIIIASLVEIYLKTKQVYQLFTLGILSLITGFVIFILKNFSLLPFNFITENSSKLGTGLEVIFLSLSMANLIKKLKKDREISQDLALRKSQEMNEMKSYFLSNISHELRTPLNTIMNFIDSIDDETDSQSIQDKCKIIKSSSSSLLSSVNDILDFSKIEKGEIKLEEVIFDTHKLFEEIKDTILIGAQNKGLEFQFTLSENVPKMAKGDVNRIRQIMLNLLCNAIKYTELGIIKFKVDTKTIDDTLAFIFIISDSGIGIPKEKIETVFDSFSQESITNKRKYGGLGLGLYIVKALVALHKGTIDIQSVLNKGTVCKINLNLTKVAEPEKINNTTTTEYNLNGKRLLVVEDNAMNQMVLKMITKKWLNTQVDYANNGEEGLAFLQNTKYDIILMDLQMPIMDGYEATIEIRKGNSGINNKDIPIIALTADVMETTKQTVFDIGMNDYLTKPISKELLFEAISKIIDK